MENLRHYTVCFFKIINGEEKFGQIDDIEAFSENQAVEIARDRTGLPLTEYGVWENLTKYTK